MRLSDCGAEGGFEYLTGASTIASADDGALAGVRHRVLVSSDIGGTDPDDLQSMVHLLVYADIHIVLEIHDDGTPNLYAYRRVILNVK